MDTATNKTVRLSVVIVVTMFAMLANVSKIVRHDKRFKPNRDAGFGTARRSFS